MKIGFIVNPVAGMGGRVGLKGTDGLADLAARLGGERISLKRAQEALQNIGDADNEITFLTCSGEMGEDVLRHTSFSYKVIYQIPETTTSEDTKQAACKMLDCDLILFSGGDGTACDIISVVDKQVPILGIPAGVKIFSPVFCITPQECGRIVSTFLETTVRDVLDIDEEAYRNNTLNVRIMGEALVPVSPAVQSGKEISGAVDAKRDIAQRIFDDCRAKGKDVLYIIGPGTTTMEVKHLFGIDGTLLGVDAVVNGKLVQKDACEKHLLKAIETYPTRVMIIVSPIGSQGFIFGRGNQQISPSIINKADEIKIIASPDKLATTPVLHVDTGDLELDTRLRGYIKVQSGYHDLTIMKVV